MDHNYAIENHTAERYLMEELPQDERDAYEEHYFSCPACAEEVKSASEFIECARKVVQDDVKAAIYRNAVDRTSVWGNWLNWRSLMQPVPAMACVLLVFVGGFSTYQNSVTIPQLRLAAAVQPPVTMMAQVITSDPFRLAEARRGEENPINQSKDKPVSLQFDIPPAKFSFYELAINTDSGVRKLLLNRISAEDANNPVLVVIPAGVLQSGNYEVVIQGVTSNGTESGIKGKPVRLPFQLKIQD